MKIEKAKAEEHAKPVPANKAEAQKLTADVRKGAQQIELNWWSLIKKVDLCLRRHVPDALNKTTKAWMSENLDGSLSDGFRKLRWYRVLRGVPEEAIRAIPGKNMGQLMRLQAVSKEEVKSPAWISRAQDMTPAAMEKKVDERLAERGIKKEEYVTFSLRVTKAAAEELNDAENKIAGLLGMDTEHDLSPSDRAKVWSHIAILCLTTEEERLRVEMQGAD